MELAHRPAGHRHAPEQQRAGPDAERAEGLVAAEQVRSSSPGVGVLVLSQYLEARYATRLLQDHPEALGYLLKERVSDISVLKDALQRIAEGECVLDPTIVARLLRRPRRPGPLDELTEREREVLALIAEGRSNRGIAEILVLSPKTVEAHVGASWPSSVWTTPRTITAVSSPCWPSSAPERRGFPSQHSRTVKG